LLHSSHRVIYLRLQSNLKAFFISILNTTQRYTLGKTERLKSRKLIEQLFKEGKSFSNFPFRVLYLPVEGEAALKQDVLQCGFGVSTRHFKKAVHRNRVKRLAREAWRLQKNELQQWLAARQKHLAVFMIYTGNEIPPYPLVYEKTGSIIKRLKEKIGAAQS
jgi:ribonuclease P protein component